MTGIITMALRMKLSAIRCIHLNDLEGLKSIMKDIRGAMNLEWKHIFMKEAFIMGNKEIINYVSKEI